MNDFIQYLQNNGFSGKLPPRIVIYGTAKIGKTTFGAAAPDPVFIQTEDGLSGLNGILSFELCTNLDMVLSQLETLRVQQHNLKTLVLDSLDWLEKLIFNKVAADNQKSFVGDIGYGKGYSEANDHFISILNKLDQLRRERGMMVILLAHDESKRFDDPASASYHRYSLKLHKSNSEKIQEWADVIGFAHKKVFVQQDSVGFNNKRARATGGEERILSLEEKAAFIAGNRYGLKDEIPLSFAEFRQEFETKTGRAIVG